VDVCANRYTKAYRLPATQLELNTMAHVGCALDAGGRYSKSDTSGIVIVDDLCSFICFEIH
jgi:hypothetical protein